MTATLKNPRSIFLEAIENHSPETWPAFLDSACNGDTHLRDQVTRLLSAHGRLDGFMGQPAAPVLSSQPPAADFSGQTIGRYKLMEQIGEGGMGVVYVAEQTEPVRRQVALKIIKPGMDSRQVIARFEAERQALALMDHPNIARILDGGMTDEGRPYFVMEFVRGLPVTDYCDQARLAPRERLKLFITVCQAVQHAHQKGIIHRDLKPSNVLVTSADGKPVVKVIDFGVAKALSPLPLGEGQGEGEGVRLTEKTLHTGFAQMIGTPLYMSPEQAALSALDIDTRSDVYSLGVLLYELLTGRTPFDAETLKSAGFDEMRRIIREDDPPRPSARVQSSPGYPPRGSAPCEEPGSVTRSVTTTLATISDRRGLDHRRLVHDLRGELDWIVMKALEKDRNRRYESASSLAADLQRYLNHEPIHARPASFVSRALKWRQRNPVAFLTGIASLLVLAATIGAGVWHNHRLSGLLATEAKLRQEGWERETLLRQEKYYTDIRDAWQQHQAGNTNEVRRLVELYEPKPNEPDVTGFEWHYLRHLSRPALRTTTDHDDVILNCDVSPDAGSGVKYVASGDKGGGLVVRELLSGKLVFSVNYSQMEIIEVRFSPDGQYLATGGVDRTVHLFKVGTWEEVATLRDHQGSICGLAWSPDMKYLASAGRFDENVVVWKLADRSLVTRLWHRGPVRALAFSPDGKHLATGDDVHSIRLWDTKRWRERKTFPWEAKNPIQALSYSRDGAFLAAGGWRSRLRLFRVDDGTEVVADAFEGTICSVEFLTKELIAIGQGDGRVRIFRHARDAGTFKMLHERTVGQGTVRRIALADKGRIVVTALEEDKAVTVWDGASIHGRTSANFQWPNGYSSKYDLVLSCQNSQQVIYEGDSGGIVASLPFDTVKLMCNVDSPSENLVAIEQSDGRVLVWSGVKRDLLATLLPAAAGKISEFAFSSDDRWLAAAYQNSAVGAWNLETGKWHPIPPADSTNPARITWLRTGNVLALSHHSSLITVVWDMDRQCVKSSFRVDASPTEHCFVDEGRTLAIGQEDGTISLWSVATGQRLGQLTAHTGRIFRLWLSPDGRTLASHSDDGTARLWQVATRREMVVVCDNFYRAGFAFSGENHLILAHEPHSDLMILPGPNYRPVIEPANP